MMSIAFFEELPGTEDGGSEFTTLVAMDRFFQFQKRVFHFAHRVFCEPAVDHPLGLDIFCIFVL
jgi:hypothetical protein